MRADLANELRRVSEQIADLTSPPVEAAQHQPEFSEPPVSDDPIDLDDADRHFTAVTTTFVPPPPPEEIHPAFSSHSAPVAHDDEPIFEPLEAAEHGHHAEEQRGIEEQHQPQFEQEPQFEDSPQFEEPVFEDPVFEDPVFEQPGSEQPEQYQHEFHDPDHDPVYESTNAEEHPPVNHGDSFSTDSYEPDSFEPDPYVEAAGDDHTPHDQSFEPHDAQLHEPQQDESQHQVQHQAQHQAQHEVTIYEADPFDEVQQGGEFIPQNQQHPQSDQDLPPQLARPQSVRKPQAAEAAKDSAGNSLMDQYQTIKPSGMVLAVVGVSLALMAGLLWFGGNDQPAETAVEAVEPASPTSLLPQVSGTNVSAVLENVRVVLAGLGLSSVVVDHRDGVIHVGGPVPTQADYDAAASAATAVAEGFPVDTSALIAMAAEDQAPAPTDGAGRPAALQSELNRILAGTPLIFSSGQASISELHQRILNNVVLALSAYPGFSLTIAGFTDELGDNSSNEGLSLARAESVRDYLVGQGLPAEAFEVQARGEDAATGSAGLAGLERRVEFVVNGAAEPVADQATLRVGIVAPSASNDLAFTQSMVDAVSLLSTETPIEVSVTDNTFVPEEAAAAVRSYAEQDFDLVIAHGSQFGASLIDIAPQFPETAFAWGTASDTFGLPNVYAYDAAAQQGGYLLGVVAAMMSANDVVGVVGPIEVGDAALYVNGFEAGAKAQKPGGGVLVSYTGSFSDIGLATETAQSHIAVGADVLTGSAQMVVGAVAAAEQAGALWFGTQSNQASLAPGSVVASQVYRWEVALRPIIEDIRAGTLQGTTYTADLANGGLVIEYNDAVPLSPEVRGRADQVFAEIVDGRIVPPTE